MGDPDQPIIARCRQGDKAAFGELVDRHKAVVFSLVQRLVKDPTEAEDLSQDTFVKAYVALGRFRGDCSFRNWLCRIANRLCIDHLRTQRRRPTVPLEDDVGGEDSTLSQEVEARLEATAISQAMAELPPAYRAALELRHVHHLSYQEIAEALKVPLPTVKTHLLRGRLQLRRQLGPALGREVKEGTAK